MSYVSAFVHLYHVWGVWGLITALIFGTQAHRNWRAAGGRWRDIPRDVGTALGQGVKQSLLDFWRLLRWFAAGLIGIALKRGDAGLPEIDLFFPGPEQSRWPRNQTLLLGITLGGASRLFTALYWSEANTQWMGEASVLIPSIPIVMAVMADTNHQFTAWPNRPWIARMLLVVAVSWILFGLLFVEQS